MRVCADRRGCGEHATLHAAAHAQPTGTNVRAVSRDRSVHQAQRARHAALFCSTRQLRIVALKPPASSAAQSRKYLQTWRIRSGDGPIEDRHVDRKVDRKVYRKVYRNTLEREDRVEDSGNNALLGGVTQLATRQLLDDGVGDELR